MTLFGDLLSVYKENEQHVGAFDDNGLTLVPVAHTQVNVQVEVALDIAGNFLSARTLEKTEQVTVIPATPTAANRTSTPAAYPLSDKIAYVAGDFADTVASKELEKAQTQHKLYRDALDGWAGSKDVPVEIKAVATYIDRDSLLKDLLTDITGKAAVSKQKKGDQFVRFVVNNVQLFKEKRIFDAWTNYFLDELLPVDATTGLDYVTGENTITTKLIEGGVSKADNNAKLISANDNTAYTYRGLFLGDEFYSIGYKTSQQVIHTFGWLVKRQSVNVGHRVFVFWGKGGNTDASVGALSALMGKRPNSLFANMVQTSAKNNIPNANDKARDVALNFHERLLGYVNQIEDSDLISVAALDAATTGRMAVVYYSQLTGSRFKENVLAWGNHAAVDRYVKDGLVKVTPSFKDIVRVAYQIGANTSRFDTLSKRSMTDLMTTVVSGRKIPNDIYQAAFRHVIRPTTYKLDTGGFDGFRWEDDLYTVAALMRYREEREKAMTTEEEKHNRSYLFGQLLAIADDMERRSMYNQRARNAAVSDRSTLAMRYYSNFVESPAETWLFIKKSLINATNRHLNSNVKSIYLNQMQEIENELGGEGMAAHTPLKPLFITGYAEKKTSIKEEKATHAKEKKND